MDGTVVQTSRSSRHLLAEYRDSIRGAAPRLTTLAAVANDSASTTHDLEFACRLETRRHFLSNPPNTPRGSTQRRSRLGARILSALLGIALIVASGGHWIPAAAGVWLLGLRELILWFLQNSATATGSPGTARMIVKRALHRGLSELREIFSVNLDERLAYLEAYEASVRLGIPEAAALYTKLLQNPNPSFLSPEDGVWLPDASRRREALVSGSSENPTSEVDIQDRIVEGEIVTAFNDPPQIEPEDEQ